MQIRLTAIAAPALFAAALALPATADTARSLAQPAEPVEIGTPVVDEVTGEPMQAVFMEVAGPVTWRASEDAPWQEAKMDDLLSPGAEIRTGFRGRAAIRVGKNATILMDPITTMVLPDIVRDGDVYRTRVAIKNGRADFKVDKVGLDNDFQVRAGSATMAVKGTGGTFSYGGFSGAEFRGANFNEINAIEVRYFSTLQQRVAISGAGRSTEANPNPVIAALASTIGPPPAGGTSDAGLGDSESDLGNLVGTDIVQQQAIVTGAQQPGNMALSGAGGFTPGGTPGFPASGGAGGGSAGGGTAGGGTGSGGILGGGGSIGGGGGIGGGRGERVRP